MRASSIVLVIAVLLLLAAIATCPAQDEKPWTHPGTKAGDEITGPDGGKMVWVPAGEFDMGSTDGNPEESPVHHVRITRGFWLGQCTVTNAQYQGYCQGTGAQFPKESDQGPSHPVLFAAWGDARAYCDHYGMALPTEAQWEYAARGPGASKYPWGDEWDPKRLCWGGNKGPGGKTFPVGSFPGGASWCGALDMAGNVCQWCSDWYDSGYYAHSDPVDPRGPDRGEDITLRPEGRPPVHLGACRVIRGNFWGDADAADFYCAMRVNLSDPEGGDALTGFRCAYTP